MASRLGTARAAVSFSSAASISRQDRSAARSFARALRRPSERFVFLVEARDRLGRGKRGAGELVERGDGRRQPQGRFRDGACLGLDRRLDLGALLEAPQDRSEGSEPLAQRFGVDRRPSCRVVLAQQAVALMLAREIGTKACELTLDRTPFAAQRAQQGELGVRGLARTWMSPIAQGQAAWRAPRASPACPGFAIDARQILLALA